MENKRELHISKQQRHGGATADPILASSTVSAAKARLNFTPILFAQAG